MLVVHVDSSSGSECAVGSFSWLLELSRCHAGLGCGAVTSLLCLVASHSCCALSVICMSSGSCWASVVWSCAVSLRWSSLILESKWVESCPSGVSPAVERAFADLLDFGLGCEFGCQLSGGCNVFNVPQSESADV